MCLRPSCCPPQRAQKTESARGRAPTMLELQPAPGDLRNSTTKPPNVQVAQTWGLQRLQCSNCFRVTPFKGIEVRALINKVQLELYLTVLILLIWGCGRRGEPRYLQIYAMGPLTTSHPNLRFGWPNLRFGRPHLRFGRPNLRSGRLYVFIWLPLWDHGAWRLCPSCCPPQRARKT